MARQKDHVEQRLARLDSMRTQRLDSLNALGTADTVAVGRHSTFLGGRHTYPKLTDREKQALTLRKKIAEQKAAVTQLEEETAELKGKLKEMEALKKKHDQYLEKRILWGFITWEVKKKGK